MPDEMHTSRGGIVRVIDTTGRVLLTVADDRDAACVVLDPLEAEHIADMLREHAHAATPVRCSHGTPIGWTCQGCDGPARTRRY